MGLFSMLMQGQNQQPYGYTYPGTGQPPTNTPVGAPQLPQDSPGSGIAAARPMAAPMMPAGATSSPQNAASGMGGMFQGLQNNPILMMALAKQMGGGSGGAGSGLSGLFTPQGANALNPFIAGNGSLPPGTGFQLQ